VEDIDRVGRLARRLAELLLDAPALSLQQRVEVLADVLPRAWLAAAVLPPAPPIPPPPVDALGEGWPGLGRFEGDDPDTPTLSDRLRVVADWLVGGLRFYQQGDIAAAVTVWSAGYPAWSTELVAMLPSLHEAVLRFRPAVEAPRARTADPSLVMVGPAHGAPPASTVAAPTPAVRPALGVRFEAIGLGAYIVEVHPRSPAAGLLQARDVVLQVGDTSLEHVDPAILAERMVGPVGEERTYVVYRDGEQLQVRFASVSTASLRGDG
jgi:hypothetical protein